MSSLERAFRSFEQAAVSLERRHASLQLEVQRLERELLDANRRLETVLDAVDSGIAVVAGDGRLLRTNAAFDAMGLLDGIALHPALAGLIGDEGEGDATRASARVRLGTDGRTRDLAATRTPTGDAENTHVLTVQDVTAIRREEEEGGRRHRLEALGRMAAELAHEVRNPLGSIRLFGGMLRQDLAGHDEQVEMIEQVLAATAGLEATVSNLLAFAAPPRAERRQVDLAALARDACALLAPACSLRDVTLRGPESETSCAIHAEAEGMRQVLLNLLGNAVTATDSGGTVELTVECDDDATRLAVRDDGRGIAAEDLPRIFDPFFSRTEGGTGLGLSIVHGIVERHDGRIAVDSRPGHGTRVEILLPAVESASARAAGCAARPAVNAVGGVRHA